MASKVAEQIRRRLARAATNPTWVRNVLLHAHNQDSDSALRSARRETARLRRMGDEPKAKVYEQVAALLAGQRTPTGNGGRPSGRT